jgi:thioredoxin 1
MDGFGFYLLLFLVAFALAQYWLVHRSRGLEGRPAPRLDDVLDAKYLDQPRLILYFWQPGSHVCGTTSMVINPLLETRRDIIKINTLEEWELARRFDVLGTPTLVVISEGRIERVLVGSRNEQQIRELVGAFEEDTDED